MKRDQEEIVTKRSLFDLIVTSLKKARQSSNAVSGFFSYTAEVVKKLYRYATISCVPFCCIVVSKLTSVA